MSPWSAARNDSSALLRNRSMGDADSRLVCDRCDDLLWRGMNDPVALLPGSASAGSLSSYAAASCSSGESFGSSCGSSSFGSRPSSTADMSTSKRTASSTSSGGTYRGRHGKYLVTFYYDTNLIVLVRFSPFDSKRRIGFRAGTQCRRRSSSTVSFEPVNRRSGGVDRGRIARRTVQ